MVTQLHHEASVRANKHAAALPPTGAGEGERQEPLSYVIALPPSPQHEPFVFPTTQPLGWRAVAKNIHRSLLIAPDATAEDRNVDVRIIGDSHTARTEAVKHLCHHLAPNAPKVHGGLGFISDVRRLLGLESACTSVLGVDRQGGVTCATTSLAFEELNTPSHFDWDQYCSLADQEWVRGAGLAGQCRKLLACLERAWRRAYYLVFLGEMSEELGRLVDFVTRASIGTDRDACATLTVRDNRDGEMEVSGRCGPEYVLVVYTPSQDSDLSYCRWYLEPSQWRALQRGLIAAQHAIAESAISAIDRPTVKTEDPPAAAEDMPTPTPTPPAAEMHVQKRSEGGKVRAKTGGAANCGQGQEGVWAAASAAVVAVVAAAAVMKRRQL